MGGDFHKIFQTGLSLLASTVEAAAEFGRKSLPPTTQAMGSDLPQSHVAPSFPQTCQLDSDSKWLNQAGIRFSPKPQEPTAFAGMAFDTVIDPVNFLFPTPFVQACLIEPDIQNGSVFPSSYFKNAWIHSWGGSEGSSLKEDNPIHDLFYIEAPLYDEKSIKEGYQVVTEVLKEVRERTELKELTPEEKLKTVYDVLKEKGYEYEPTVTLTEGLKKHKLDCDTTSYIVLAVAHEMDWPVYGIEVPQHFFVRWDDGNGKRFNMDLEGRSHPDDYYKREFYQSHGMIEISDNSIKKGVYLKNLDRKELIGVFFTIRGAEWEDRRSYSKAKVDYNLALTLDPENAFAYLGRSKLEEEKGDLRGAQSDLNRFVSLVPNLSEAYSKLARLEFQLGEDEDARLHNEKGGLLNESDHYVFQATLELQNKNPQKAKEYFEQALQSNPENMNARYYLALAEYSLKNDSEAVAQLDRVIQSEPNNMEARYYRATCLVGLKRNEEAKADLDSVIAQDPKNTDAHYLRGIAYQFLRQDNEAVADFNIILQANPNNSNALYYRGASLFYLGKNAEALEDFNKALIQVPKDRSSRNLRGLALLDLNKFEEAKADFEKVLQEDPKNQTALIGQGLVLYKLKNYRDAIASFNQAIQLNPKNPAPLLFRASAEKRLGESAKAKKDFQNTIVLCDRLAHEDPNSPETKSNLYYRAASYYGLGEYQKAIADFEVLLQTETNHGNKVADYVYLGFAYAKIGNSDQSIFYFKKAFELDSFKAIDHTFNIAMD